jgi:hypothetical protein
MVLIERSVETLRSRSITTRSLAGPTSRRLCRCADVKKASNQLYPLSEDTKQGSYFKMSILNVWSVETPRCPAWLQGVWQSHSRHADLRKVSNPSAQVPGSTWQGHQARTTQGGLHSRHETTCVQSGSVVLQRHTDLGRSRTRGAQLGWQSLRIPRYCNTWVLRHTDLKEVVLVSRRPT